MLSGTCVTSGGTNGSSKAMQFDLHEASGDALAESQNVVTKAKQALYKDGAFKEAVKGRE